MRAPRSTLVHITSLSSPGRTACGKQCRQWLVAKTRLRKVGWSIAPVTADVTCMACKEAIYFRVSCKGKR